LTRRRPYTSAQAAAAARRAVNDERRFEEITNMLQLGMVAVALGIIGFIWGVLQKIKAGRVAGAPLVKTGDAAARGAAAAGPKGAISAQGNVICPQPILSPVTGTACLFYELKCTASWKDGENTKTKEIHKEKNAAPFTIDDGSGPVPVDAREGGDFEPTKKHEETKGGGLLGAILGGEVAFGSYRFQSGMFTVGAKFTIVEQVLPLQQHLYACGKAADVGGTITAPSWRSLILSSKTRDELLAHATKSAKMFLIGGAATFVVGGALAALAPKPEPIASAEPATTSTAALSAAPPEDSAAATDTAQPDATATGAAPKPSIKPASKPVAPAKAPAPVKAPAPAKPKK
jgi:hypothetical protein